MTVARRYPLFAIIAAVLFWASGALAQSLGSSESEVLVIDPNRLFAETLFGKRINSELEAEGAALSAENRRIEDDLRAEEKALTEAREEMSPEDFRGAAEAFDLKVQGIRRERLQKVRALDEKRDTALQRFLSAAQGALVAVMRERGASVLIDARNVVLSDGAIDITNEAVVKIDEAIGAGESTQDTQEQGEQSQD